MRDLPIIMADESVRLLLAKLKKQTRRLMNPQPDFLQHHEWRGKVIYEGENRVWCWKRHTFENIWDKYIREPDRARLVELQPVRVGDRLWVRETWGIGTRPCPLAGWRDGIEYRADATDGTDLPLHALPNDLDATSIRRGWRPSIHMPRWASRITLDVTEVRVEPLHEITEEDSMAEGVGSGLIPPDEYGPLRIGYVYGKDDGNCTLYPTARKAYATVWDELHGAGSWDRNPWVRVVTFEVRS